MDAGTGTLADNRKGSLSIITISADFHSWGFLDAGKCFVLSGSQSKKGG